MKPNIRPRLQRALGHEPAEAVTKLLRRIDHQIAFARAFADIAEERSVDGWDAIIDGAESTIDDVDPSAGIAGLRLAVEEAEARMAPIGRAAKEYTVHCVGHGHIDMNWMWSWPETVAQCHDTFASVLSFMDQYPDVTYSQSQASVYAIVEKYYPRMFDQIRKRVKEGRWEIATVQWVEGDKNISSAESLCRHILYTRQFMKDKFGLSPEDLPMDWEPDTFGHAVTIPAIDKQGAVKFYYCCRPGGGAEHARVGDERPQLFYWQAPSGERILVNREATWYNTFGDMDESPAIPLVNFAKETGLHEWLNMYGIGNHGGGPTRYQIDFYKETSTWPVYPNVIFSTALKFFQKIEKEIEASGKEPKLPVIDHELNFEFTGCYTTQTLIKRGNRFGENYLVEAETLNTIAARLYGREYEKEQLRESWISVCFNQFHDIVTGSGVRETREHAQALFQEVGAVTGALKRIAMSEMANRIDTLALVPIGALGDEERALVAKQVANTPFVAGAGLGSRQSGYSQGSGGGRNFLPFVVYNPVTWPRSERVVVRLYDTDFDASRIVAVDETGKAQPVVVLDKASEWGHDYIEAAFNAEAVPALGYRTYVFRQGVPEKISAPVSQAADYWYETPTLKFKVDRWRSGISSLVDKRTGAILADDEAPLGQWDYITERPRGMTAWVLGEVVDEPIKLKSASFRRIGGTVAIGTGNPGTANSAGYETRSVLEVPGTESTVTLRTVVNGLEPRIDFIAEVDWREIGTEKRGIPGLIVNFPLPLTNIKTTYEVPFGSVERSLFKGEEVPALRWANVTGKALTGAGKAVDADVTLVQDCKYGHSIVGNNLRLRIIRSSFDPDHAPEVCKAVIRYALIFGDGSSQPADLTRLGAGFNHPMIFTPTTLHKGSAPAKNGFAQVGTPNVVLTALKQAENGKGIIVRLSELNGEDTEAIVEFDDEFSSGLDEATVVDLMERPTGAAARWTPALLKVKVPANGFVTVRIV